MWSRHLAHTQQDYEEANNSDYQIAEHRLLGIVSHYCKKKRTPGQNHSRWDKHPADLQQWSRDLSTGLFKQQSRNSSLERETAADLPPDHGVGAGETTLAPPPAVGPQDHAPGLNIDHPAGTSAAATKHTETTVATTRAMIAGTPTRENRNSTALKMLKQQEMECQTQGSSRRC